MQGYADNTLCTGWYGWDVRSGFYLVNLASYKDAAPLVIYIGFGPESGMVIGSIGFCTAYNYGELQPGIVLCSSGANIIRVIRQCCPEAAHPPA